MTSRPAHDRGRCSRSSTMECESRSPRGRASSTATAPDFACLPARSPAPRRHPRGSSMPSFGRSRIRATVTSIVSCTGVSHVPRRASWLAARARQTPSRSSGSGWGRWVGSSSGYLDRRPCSPPSSVCSRRACSTARMASSRGYASRSHAWGTGSTSAGTRSCISVSSEGSRRASQLPDARPAGRRSRGSAQGSSAPSP